MMLFPQICNCVNIAPRVLKDDVCFPSTLLGLAASYLNEHKHNSVVACLREWLEINHPEAAQEQGLMLSVNLYSGVWPFFIVCKYIQRIGESFRVKGLQRRGFQNLKYFFHLYIR